MNLKFLLRHLTFPFFINKVEEIYVPSVYEKTGTIVDNWIEELDKNGFCIIENFYDEKDLELLLLEIQKIEDNSRNGKYKSNLQDSNGIWEIFHKGSLRVFGIDKISDTIAKLFSRNELFTKVTDVYTGTIDNFSWTLYQKTSYSKGLGVQDLYGGYYHIDSARRQLKVFIYLSDVVEENGPFYYVPASHKLDELKLKYIKNSFINGNNCFDRSITERDGNDYGVFSKAIPLIGKKGTVILADPRGWHAAGNICSGERKVLVNYNHKSHIKPIKFFGKQIMMGI